MVHFMCQSGLAVVSRYSDINLVQQYQHFVDVTEIQ